MRQAIYSCLRIYYYKIFVEKTRMEFTFSQLKQKDVINLNDGKNLGRVCDVTYVWPENKLTGITVTGGRGFRFMRQDMFIPVSCIVKIGEDAVLVKTDNGEKMSA